MTTKVQTHTSSALRTGDPAIVDEIIHVINEAYYTVAPSNKRIKSTQRLFDDLGTNGLVATVRDLETGRVVATACVHVWDQVGHFVLYISCSILVLFPHPYYKRRHCPETAPTDTDTHQLDHNYELFGVACLPLPQYRKRGLVDQCMSALERDLLLQTPVDQQLRFWIRIVEYVNGPYWRKKGFVESARETMEVGHWGYECVWDMVTMVKVIDKSSVVD